MSKPAVAAALSLALSLGAVCQAKAQESTSTDDGASAKAQRISQANSQSDLPTGFRAPQATTNQVTYPGSAPQGWQTNPVTGIGGPYQKPGTTSTSTTTTTTTTSTTPAVPPRRENTQPRAIPGFPGYPISPRTTSAPRSTPAAPLAPAQSTKKSDDTVIVQQGPPDIAQKAGWCRFENYITLKNGQDQLNPLTLRVTNGAGGPGFNAVRLMLSGRQIASEKDFKDGSLTMSMVGALGNGTNQLVISAYGVAGAKLQWKVVTMKPSLASADPKEIAAGEKITLKGKNFSPSISVDQVFIGDKAATVLTATPVQIEATVPDTTPSGDQKVIVRVGGVDTKPVTISVKLVPILNSVDYFSAPPGQPITISGKNFAPNAGDNQVLIGGASAPITSASTTSISCVIPELDNPQYGVEIVVKSKKVESKNKLKIDLQRRVIPNDGGSPQY